MSSLKRSLLKLTHLPGLSLLLSPIMRGWGVIFMLHRFRDPELGVEGHDPKLIRACLAHLRKRGYTLLSLEELFRRMAEGKPLQRVAAFTIDDGYRDHATVGAPVFAEFDCPVTTFLITGFLDGMKWFWWDQVDYIFSNTRRTELRVTTEKAELNYRWADEAGRHRAQVDFAGQCKAVPDRGGAAAIPSLAKAAEVELPEQPPSCYTPMSWDEARACERRGMTFGPHTVTHPVLSLTSDEQARREISQSWERVKAELQHPVPVFCYPYGEAWHAGPREAAILKSMGFLGAVVGVAGYTRTELFQRSPEARYRVRRFGFPDNMPDFIQIVDGIERFKQILRRESN